MNGKTNSDAGMRLRKRDVSSDITMPRMLATALCVFAACIAFLTFSGCEDSDVLTEIIYMQNSPIVDYENESKIKTPSDNGEIYDPSAPITRLEEQGQSDYQTVRMAYSSNPETDLPTPRYVYDPEGRFDTEASEVPIAVSDQNEPPQEESPVQDPEASSDESNSGAQSDGNDESDESGGAQNSQSPNLSDQEANGGRTDRGDQSVYDLRGEYTEVPKANTIAAYGSTAVAVQMLAGEGPLVGADATTLSGGFSTVFADEGAASITQMWSDSGTSSGIDIDAVLNAGVDAVIIDSIQALTDEQKAELNEWGTAVVIIPGFSSATKLLASMKVLGEMLDQSDRVQFGVNPTSRASEYTDYHQNLCKEILDANGGFTSLDQSRRNVDNVVYEEAWYVIDAGQNVAYSSRAMFTLLIEDWDYNARYKGTIGGQRLLQSNNGVGFANIGCGSSPVSYYMGVGGAGNNAAYYGNWEMPGVVWQVNLMHAKAGASNWDYDSSSPFARGVWSTDDSTNMNKVLLYSADRRRNYANRLGEEGYPAVIVTDARMKDAMIADAVSGSGIYTPYNDGVADDGTELSGLRYGSTIASCGVSPSIDWNNAILINPAGLVSSWTEGSVESVLEAPWIASQSQFKSGWHGNFEQEVKEFYHTFYRYDLSDAEFAAMLGGA